MYLKYEEITVNMARQSEVSVLEHVIKDPADMTTQVSFIGIGESLHYDRHVAGRLVVHQQQTLAVNALRYVVTRLHDWQQNEHITNYARCNNINKWSK